MKESGERETIKKCNYFGELEVALDCADDSDCAHDRTCDGCYGGGN